MRLLRSLATSFAPFATSKLRPLWIRWNRVIIQRRGYIVNPVGRRLYVDPDDPRALRLARNGGITSPPLIQKWQELVREIKPSIVVDIGANYGEVALSSTYDRETEVHVIEANDAILPFLQRSIREANLGVRADVHGCAASDRDGYVSLEVNSTSSGLSRVRGADGQDEAGRCREVRAMRVDSLIPSRHAGSLLFKIDVEGYELPVLDGMAALLHGRRYAGIVEMWPGNGKAEQVIASHTVSVINRVTLKTTQLDVSQLELHLTSPDPDRLRDVLLTPRDQCAPVPES